ncbi:hypothetical protein BDV32DRAFT_130125 [Aspergillus pseudonomiae]|nr:hypothetical protein BDV32DRAFT_130125 [Aspergillus pseudonomiae]
MATGRIYRLEEQAEAATDQVDNVLRLTRNGVLGEFLRGTRRSVTLCSWGFCRLPSESLL